MSRLRFILTVSSILLLLDQLTKIWARKNLAGQPGHSYLGGFFRIEFAENPGAFLSLGAQLPDPIRRAVFTGAVGVFLVGLFVYLIRSRSLDRTSVCGMTLLFAGGVGNLIDRAMKSSVTDFLILGFRPPLQTGVFNIADMAIMCGIVLVFAAGFIHKPKHHAKT